MQGVELGEARKVMDLAYHVPWETYHRSGRSRAPHAKNLGVSRC
jgi:hypothetical protein